MGLKAYFLIQTFLQVVPLPELFLMP